MSKQTSSRRKFGRIRTELPVRFWVAHHDSLTDHREGRTVDVSAGGLLCRFRALDDEFLDELIEAQSAIELQIQLPQGGYRVRGSGRIVWMEELGDECLIRVCFTGFRHEGEKRFNRFLSDVTSRLGKATQPVPERRDHQ